MRKDYLKNNLLPNHGELYFIPDFLSDFSLDEIIHDIHWRNDKIKMFGKVFEQPRKVAWYGDPQAAYTYSGIEMTPLPWTSTLETINSKVEGELKQAFNSVLINLYRDGNDHMSWHSDDEKELGAQPCIASLSFGEPRDFYVRSKRDHQQKIKLELTNGSLLIMKGEMQKYWQHSIPKRKRVTSPRLNLTYRLIQA
jgi:alkylated DNA repair dioxygenase AlkB